MASTQNTGDGPTAGTGESPRERLQALFRSLLPADIVGRFDGSQCGQDSEQTTRRPETFDSDEAHVRWLVDTHGGRIKQSAVVSETGWSAAKVSRLLSDMEAAGEIHRYRVSHEKVVCFPESAS